MMCVNAIGRVLPSYLIYEKNIPKMAADVKLPEKWLMAASPNGTYVDYILSYNFAVMFHFSLCFH